MKNINIYLIRHGESEMNIIPHIIGQSPDTKLTENGICQAEKLGNRFSDLRSSVFMASSSYERAHRTALIVKSKVKINNNISVHDELVEYSAGQWVGKNRHEIFSD